MSQILNKNGVQKGIIEIGSNIIRPTPLGIEKFKQLDSSFHNSVLNQITIQGW
jgi:hypothetical protein